MALFQSDNPKEQQHKGIVGAFSVDTIKWEPESDQEASVIVHKFEYEDFPNGSYLHVGTSQMAIFINNMTAGNSLSANGEGQSQVSVFVGPYKSKLETGNSRFAPFKNIANTLTGGESAYHCMVYFVNTTYMNELNWGTQAPIMVTDPEEEVNVHVRAFGLFGAHIEQVDSEKGVIDARKFLQKVVGTRADFTREEFIGFMRAKILEYVPDLLAKSMVDNHVGILKISTKLSEFSSIIFEQLREHFSEFGVTLDNFSFHNINAPDEDLQAINELKIKRKQLQLEAEGNAVKMDIESAARARMREREGYTYQQEQAYGVMHDAASNEGTSSGFMGAGMGLGMGFGVGGAIGGGISSIAQESLGSQALSTSGTEQSGTVKCGKCGKGNPADARFCLECGEPLSLGLTCPECGKQLISGAKFCPYCGKKMALVCPKCGKEVVEGAKFCLECGEKL
ncbi:MAG: SPFH domain-containing protein [Lachnospiraceae bacterium]|nr:SPFH domain-containing protein [Lachnospiraceae bacterium]